MAEIIAIVYPDEGRAREVIDSLKALQAENAATFGSGRVVVLSRGYGNCRIASTRLPRIWRVTYFNSTDLVILDTLEVSLVPEVACAAAEDLEDSAERLAEVLDWVQQG